MSSIAWKEIYIFFITYLPLTLITSLLRIYSLEFNKEENHFDGDLLYGGESVGGRELQLVFEHLFLCGGGENCINLL